jgi:hypothetical protein
MRPLARWHFCLRFAKAAKQARGARASVDFHHARRSALLDLTHLTDQTTAHRN